MPRYVVSESKLLSSLKLLFQQQAKFHLRILSNSKYTLSLNVASIQHFEAPGSCTLARNTSNYNTYK